MRRRGSNLAALNQYKYARFMGLLKTKKKSVRAVPEGLDRVKKERFQIGYKFGDFIARFEKNSVFTYARYNSSYVMAKRSDALYSLSNITDSAAGHYLFHYPIFSLDGTWRQQTRPTDFDSVLGPTTIKFLPHDPIMRSFQKYPDLFRRMVTAFNSKRLVVIAPEYVRQEVKILKWTEFIPYESPEQLQEAVLTRLDAPSSLFLLLSIPGDVPTQIDQLHSVVKGRHWLIDGGSTFDNFASPEHRREEYMTKMRSQWESFYGNNLFSVGAPPTGAPVTRGAPAGRRVALTSGVKATTNVKVI